VAHPYKASKAWHHSVQLAADVERLITHFAQNGEQVMARRLELASQSAHRWLADSHQHELITDRLICYQKARRAIQQVQEDLSVALGLRYIDKALHEQLAGQAIVIYRLLSELIQTTSRAAS
jgi:four helix bundle protein